MKLPRMLSLATLITFMAGACASTGTPAPAFPPAVEPDEVAATLPPSWTETPLPEPSLSPTMTASIPPTETETSSPTEIATIEPSPTLPAASPTPPKTEPERIVTAAWQAYLERDEARLSSYYNAHGKQICMLGFGSMLRCVGIAYQARDLRTLEHWYTMEPIYLTDEAAFVFLVTKWATSDAHWEHLFTLYKEDGVWWLDDPETIVYEYYPE